MKSGAVGAKRACPYGPQGMSVEDQEKLNQQSSFESDKRNQIEIQGQANSDPSSQTQNADDRPIAQNFKR